MIAKRCRHCRTPLEPAAPTGKGGRRRQAYCSQACRQAAYEKREGLRKDHPPRACDWCGKRFKPDRKGARFHAPECRAAELQERRKAERASSRPA